MTSMSMAVIVTTIVWFYVCTKVGNIDGFGRGHWFCLYEFRHCDLKFFNYYFRSPRKPKTIIKMSDGEDDFMCDDEEDYGLVSTT